MTDAAQAADVSHPLPVFPPEEVLRFFLNFRALRDDPSAAYPDVLAQIREAARRTKVGIELDAAPAIARRIELAKDEIRHVHSIGGLEATQDEMAATIEAIAGVTFNLSDLSLDELLELSEHWLLGMVQDPQAGSAVAAKVAYDAVMIGRNAQQTAAASEAQIDGAAKTCATDANELSPADGMFSGPLFDVVTLRKAFDDGGLGVTGVTTLPQDANEEIEPSAGDAPRPSIFPDWFASAAGEFIQSQKEAGVVLPDWAKEFAVDISHEALRCYLYAGAEGEDDVEIVIDDPQFLFVNGPTGDHLIVDADGDGVTVPAGWTQITHKARPGKFVFGVE